MGLGLWPGDYGRRTMDLGPRARAGVAVACRGTQSVVGGRDGRQEDLGWYVEANAKLDEVGDDVLVIVVKNEQTAIPKEEIDRLDFRPKGRKTTSEIRKGAKVPDRTPPLGMNRGPNVPQDGWSSGVTFTKPGYETIYRRPK